MERDSEIGRKYREYHETIVNLKRLRDEEEKLEKKDPQDLIDVIKITVSGELSHLVAVDTLIDQAVELRECLLGAEKKAEIAKIFKQIKILKKELDQLVDFPSFSVKVNELNKN